MRYELTNCEWFTIKPLLPNKPRGVPRVNKPFFASRQAAEWTGALAEDNNATRTRPKRPSPVAAPKSATIAEK
jgi:transposase